ncbi:FAD-dependent oxidoreductase [Streptomyces sp. ISL-36]|uniref:NAD(P)/FAD-dependent oxidoreductase n=1 Tax=Streptomyces sp. ISL-36 TaxID=2819182 RepID=UPI001BEC296E|nr:FAD-dependent oxidoreductase [Streptomyces sp. ISL-36]MBT2443466.1 FAD-dependent oxidoreductase [Streptomyces sp. ISL-36]
MKTTPQHRTTTRVLVLGAGYAGLIAALRLAPHARVTLVDPADHFTERVRLHERAAGRPDVTHPLSLFLHGTGIDHIAARATSLDPEARLVSTDDGRSLPYDRLVYALGSRTGLPAGTTDTRAYTAESAAELHKHLRDRPGSVAVVGGGLTGIEMAAELAETYGPGGARVRLLTAADRIGTGLSSRGAAHARSVLEARGVRIEEGRRVAHPADADAEVVVWSAALVPNSELASSAGLSLAPSGRIAVDAALRSVSHPDIYVPGDAGAAASPAAGALRMACATALPTGSHAGASIIRELRGEEPEPLDFGYLIQCVSLGRHDGLIQFVRPDDSPRERFLTGRTAAFTKEKVVRSTVRFLREAARHPSLVHLIPGIG